MVAASSVNKTLPIGPRGTAQAARLGWGWPFRHAQVTRLEWGLAHEAYSDDMIEVGMGTVPTLIPYNS